MTGESRRLGVGSIETASVCATSVEMSRLVLASVETASIRTASIVVDPVELASNEEGDGGGAMAEGG